MYIPVFMQEMRTDPTLFFMLGKAQNLSVSFGFLVIGRGRWQVACPSRKEKRSSFQVELLLMVHPMTTCESPSFSTTHFEMWFFMYLISLTIPTVTFLIRIN
jgi:hypothetical protein